MKEFTVILETLSDPHISTDNAHKKKIQMCYENMVISSNSIIFN